MSEHSANSDRSQYLDHTSPIPLKEQLVSSLRKRINDGEWPQDTAIPSEKNLCTIYNVSRVTARNAVLQLVSEGLLYRISGKGTYVSSPKTIISNLTTVGLREQLESQGRHVSTKLINVSRLSGNAFIAGKLRINSNDFFYLVERVRSINDVPVCYYESYFPVNLVPNLEKQDIDQKPLLEILRDEYQLNRSVIDEYLESYVADSAMASHLKIKSGFPLLLLEDYVSDENGLFFEYCRVYFRGDKIKLNLRYKS